MTISDIRPQYRPGAVWTAKRDGRQIRIVTEVHSDFAERAFLVRGTSGATRTRHLTISGLLRKYRPANEGYE